MGQNNMLYLQFIVHKFLLQIKGEGDFRPSILVFTVEHVSSTHGLIVANVGGEY